MEHMHLVVNLSGDISSSNPSNNAINDSGIFLKLNKALLISKRHSILLNEEYYKYAIELTVNGGFK